MNSVIKLSDIALDEQGRLLLDVRELADLRTNAAAVATLHQAASPSLLARTHLRLTREGAYLAFAGLVPKEDLHEELARIAKWTRAIEDHGLDPTPKTTKQLEEAESAFDAATLQSLCGALGRVVTSQARRVEAEVSESPLQVSIPHRAQVHLYTSPRQATTQEPRDAPIVQSVVERTEVLFSDGSAALVDRGDAIRPQQQVLISLRAPREFTWDDQPWSTDKGEHESRD